MSDNNRKKKEKKNEGHHSHHKATDQAEEAKRSSRKSTTKNEKISSKASVAGATSGKQQASSKPAVNNSTRRKDEKIGPLLDCKNPSICKYFLSKDGCKKGDMCTFHHGAKDKGKDGTNVMPAGKSNSNVNMSKYSSEIERFLNDIPHKLKSASFLITSENSGIWNQSFEAVANSGGGDTRYHRGILELYLKATESDISTPRVEFVLKILIALLKANVNPDTFRLAHQIIQARLVRTASCDKIQDRDAILQLIDEMDGVRSRAFITLVNRFSEEEYTDCANELKKAINAYKQQVQVITIKVSTTSMEEMVPTQPSYGWIQNPSLAWLLDKRWLNVKDFQDSYEDLDQYIATMQQMWTLLTFYWGAAAFWPRCNVRGGGGSDRDSCCGNPLMHFRMNSHSTCCKSSCNRPARWGCCRRDHDKICDECLVRCQDKLMGPAGKDASTDIYDACIVGLGENKTLHCAHLLSRRPPQVDVNWQTSYRLQVSNMVAVIPVTMNNIPLKKSDPVFWGEIVVFSYKDTNQKEAGRRKNGNISIRLLGKSDCSLLNDFTDDDILYGQKIVIVDLRVFVPEVMSVLATLSSPSFKQGLTRVSFQKSLLDSSTAHMMPLVRLSLKDMIDYALHNTSISAVATLNENDKIQLVEQIWAIPQVKTLDETQGIAFASALLQSLHTVQGPPGSGKSYVGVCLLLALSKIRQFLNKGNRKGSFGPIIVLAYKNHALDEFLLDALRADSNLKGRGTLVRLGKPDNSELTEFTERNSDLERNAKRKLLERLETIRVCKQQLARIRAASFLTDQAASEAVTSCLAICVQALIVFDMSATADVQYVVDDYDEASDDGYLPIAEVAKQPLSKKIFSILKDLFTKGKLSDWKTITLALQSMNLIETTILPFMASVHHWGRHGMLIPGDIDKARYSSRFSFLYGKLISGDVPPTRCSAVVNGPNNETMQCLNCTAHKDSKYCDIVHRCKHVSHCEGLALIGATCCEMHVCMHENCSKDRVFNSNFCIDHSCPYCLEVKDDILSACHHHQCKIRGCRNAVILGLEFCTYHCCGFCFSQGKVTEFSRVLLGNDKETCEFHRCRIDNCVLPRIDGMDLCDRHCCICCDKRVILGMRYCHDHKCNDDQCGNPIVRTQRAFSKFCGEHSCYICASMPKPAVDYAVNRNTCLQHQLCEGFMSDGNLCFALPAKEGDIYCVDHMDNNVTCFAIAKKSKQRCRSAPLNGSLYCTNHQDQAKLYIGANGDKKKSNPQPQWTNLNVFSSFPHLKHENVPPEMWNVKPEGCIVLQCNHDRTCSASAFFPIEVLEDVNAHGGWYCACHSRNPFLHLDTSNSGQVIPLNNEGCEDHNIQEIDMQSKIATKDTEVLPSNNPTNPEEEYSFQYREHLANDPMNADEMEMEEYEDDEGNPNNMHNREIFQEDVDLELEEEVPDEIIIENLPELDWRHIDHRTLNGEILLKSIKDFLSIDWSMSLNQRHQSILSFVSFAVRVLKVMLRMAEPYVDDARREKDEANGLALRQASVIGGTVIGAAKRLSALRSAEPFAVIVEEACEVMEPVLIAVLAVESLQKLELIGDHRQLPAYVNQYWYDISLSKPNLKTSLFERIVLGIVRETRDEDRMPRLGNHPVKSSSAYANHPICTILDIQRRMRSSISALTKHEYKDIVMIKDHPVTSTQCIGDRLMVDKSFCTSTEQYQRLREFRKHIWSGNGRHVPGIAANIFFWDLEGNVQSRPKAGLSACNENEAEAIVGLVQYLNACGVALPAITVITPYQGQKRVLTDYLRRAGCLPKRTYNNNNSKGETKKGHRNDKDEKNGNVNGSQELSITVSTVDRYQGDENDIIILSLVRVQPGNAFVTLSNRFIVAASRARLGFYIVGSQTAVCTKNERGDLHGAEHWKRFIRHLNAVPQSPLQFASVEDADIIEEITVREQMAASKAVTWTNDDDGFFGPRVGAALPICCPQHRFESKKVVGSLKTMRHFPNTTNWSNFCCILCDFKLRCGHGCALPCHIGKEHQTHCGVKLDRPCDEHADIPLPCGELNIGHHVDWREALSTNWRCSVICPHTLDCGHEMKLPCQDLKDMLAGRKPWPRCEKTVKDFDLSCGHLIKNPKCFEEQDMLKKGIFPLCKKEVQIVKVCGHKANSVCFKAKQQELDFMSKLCQESVHTHRPRCGHNMTLKCHDRSALLQLWKQRGYAVAPPSREPTIDEKAYFGPSEDNIYTSCKSIKPCEAKITIRRDCNHTIEVNKCHSAFSMLVSKRLDPCSENMTSRCALCQDKIIVPCHMKSKFDDFDLNEIFEGRYVEEPGDANHMKRPRVVIDESFLYFQGSTPPIEGTINNLFRASNTCSNRVILRRQCGHRLEIDCRAFVALHLRYQQGDKSALLSPCDQKVPRTLSCGHIVEVLCDSMKKNEPKCKQLATENFIFPVCQHEIVAKSCSELHRMKRNWNEGKLLCKHESFMELPPCYHPVPVPCCYKDAILTKVTASTRHPTEGSTIDKSEGIIYSGTQYCLPCYEFDHETSEYAVKCMLPMKYRRAC